MCDVNRTTAAREGDRDGVAETEADSCSQCTKALDEGARFCPDCGRRLEPEVQPAREPRTGNKEQAEPDSSRQDSEQAEHQVLLPVALSQRPSNAEEAVCPACDHHLPAASVYCLRCGVRLEGRSACFRLRQITQSGQDALHELSGEENILGKDPNCQIVLDGDGYLSRKHARIAVTDDGVFLDDLGSSNGTFLRIRRSVLLEVGDEIVVGTSMLRLEESSPSCPEARPHEDK